MSAVRISELKAHLSEHLRAARRGEVVTVLDRQTPIAKIVPIENSEPWPDSVRAVRPFGTMEKPRPSNVSPEELSKALLNERQADR